MWQFTKSGYRLDDVDSYIYKISAILNLFNDTKVKRSNMGIVHSSYSHFIICKIWYLVLIKNLGAAITVGGLVLNLFRREVIDMVTYSDLFNYTLVICAIVSICISFYLCRCDTIMLLKQCTKVACIRYADFVCNLTYRYFPDF